MGGKEFYLCHIEYLEGLKIFVHAGRLGGQ